MVQAVQQKPTEDPSEFLERICQAYRKYTALDPQTLHRLEWWVWPWSLKCTWHQKLQNWEGGIGMNPSHIVDIAFTFYNIREQEKVEVASIFGEQVSGQFHQQQEVPDPHLKCLPLINAHIAKERGIEKWVPEAREKGPSLRTLGKGNSSNDVWPNPGVQLLQNLLKSPPRNLG